MKNPQSFLIYQGCPGAGKTHFCHAVISEVKESQYIRHKALWTESSFVARLKSGFNMSGSTEDAISYMFDDDLVVFDDLGSTKRGDWKEDIILQFVDYRYKIRKPTVITSNLSEIEIKEQLGFRVHSRLFDKENTILDFGKIDWRLVDIDQRP